MQVQEPKPRVFTPDELARINQAFTEHAPKFKYCPTCESDLWGIVAAPHNIHANQPPPGTLVLGGPNIPLLPVICQVCGYVVFFSMYQLGIQDMFGFAEASQALPEPEARARQELIDRRLAELKSARERAVPDAR